jgi:hypothetical protein
MTKSGASIIIGNVLRSDIRSFVIAARLKEPEVPTFGAFVRAPIQQGQAILIGLIYDIRLRDDPFLRNLAATVTPDNPNYAEIIKDQQENRAIPVEISVAAIGYGDNDGHEGHYRHGLPPQPPLILHSITSCDTDEIRAITAAPDFMRPLLDNRDIPLVELLPPVLRTAARLQPEADQEHYLVTAGRYLARQMGRDLIRLESILQRLS